MEATATRTTKGNKTTITVTLANGRSFELGGKRAERCGVVIVTDSYTRTLAEYEAYKAQGDDLDPAERAETYRYSIELRSDAAKAEKEAAKWRAAGDDSAAILVVEA